MRRQSYAVSARDSRKRSRKLTLIVTTCSAGKRCTAPISARLLPRGTLDRTAAAWLGMLAGERILAPATELYKGRAFQMARKATEEGSADLAILSAGLGYVRSNLEIPGYDLTVRAKGPGSVSLKITDGMDAGRWWAAVSKGPFSSSFVRDARHRSRVFVCLSRAYASMVEKDLIAISRIEGVQLRIFGLSIERHLDETLRSYVMPYDERLDRLGRPGTRVDFPQRALLDFVTHVMPKRSRTLEGDRRAVLARLSPVAIRRRKRRQKRVPDDSIRKLIVDLLPKVGPGSTRILRHLRDTERVSCEQGRFAKIFNDIKRTAS